MANHEQESWSVEELLQQRNRAIKDRDALADALREIKKEIDERTRSGLSSDPSDYAGAVRHVRVSVDTALAALEGEQ